MEDEMVCEVCGHHLADHEVVDREDPPPAGDRTVGIFAGQPWVGLFCPEEEAD